MASEDSAPGARVCPKPRRHHQPHCSSRGPSGDAPWLSSTPDGPSNIGSRGPVSDQTFGDINPPFMFCFFCACPAFKFSGAA